MAQAIRDELIEELLQGYSSPQDLLGEEGLFKELKKRLLERALGAELSEHLGYEKGDPAGRGGGNSRNGYSSKTVIGDDGAIEIAVPRDRNGSFEPQIVAKGQTRLDGFDDRIISLYARGLSVREIQAHPRRIFAIVSTTNIPNLAPESPTEATVDPPSRGFRLDADHPENGVLIPCVFTSQGVRCSPAPIRGAGSSSRMRNTPPSVSIFDPAHHRATNALASVASRK